jgi:hypothetical protein
MDAPHLHSMTTPTKFSLNSGGSHGERDAEGIEAGEEEWVAEEEESYKPSFLRNTSKIGLYGIFERIKLKASNFA